MSKRVSRWTAATLAVLIVGAFAVDWVHGDMRILQETPDRSFAVTGATTNYTLSGCLLPSPTHDSTWHTIAFTTEKTAFDSVLYTAYYDTLVFYTAPCNRIGIYLGGDFDSLYYWLDYSIDGRTWTSYKDSTLINSAVARGFPPDGDDWTQKIYIDLDHIIPTAEGGAVIVDTVAHSCAWPHFRMRLRNEDMAAVWQGDTTMVASVAADTAINVRAMVICGD